MSNEPAGQTEGAATRLKDALAQTAPELARAIGGPFAAAAAKLLARLLTGKDNAPESELTEALLSADPDTLVKLRLEAIAFDKSVLSHREAMAKVAAADRADARARELARRDKVPASLAVLVLGGFFLVLAAMLLGGVPDGAETEFSIMLGALATMAAAVMNYYFGSSASSREKTLLLRDADGRSRDL
ncbi:MAG: hypothetical protein V2I43_22410 [Parvularcula sp.]|jgi:hypothetical protein|nr:hypothetical protein [Parvularcula sp.]